MIRLHPYQYTYFNDVAGTVRKADDLFMLDYWGLAFKQASDGLHEQLAEQHEGSATWPQIGRLRCAGRNGRPRSRSVPISPSAG